MVRKWIVLILFIGLFLASVSVFGVSNGTIIPDPGIMQTADGNLDAYEAINGSMIVSRNENTIVRNVWINIDRPEHSGKVFLKMDDYNVDSENNDCINKLNESAWNTHYIPKNCDEVSFVAKYKISGSTDKSRDVSILSGKSFIVKDSFNLRVYEKKEVFYEDIEARWRKPVSAEKILDTKTSGNVSVNDDFVLGGSEWIQTEIEKQEDDVVFHYLEGDDDASRFMEGLQNSTVISDGESETVDVYVLPDWSPFDFSNVRKVPSAEAMYYSGSNSIYLKPSVRFGAVVHEYGHSQQEYSHISKDMKWVIEASPTYESTLAITGTGAMDKTLAERRGVIDEDIRDSVLSDRSTWASGTPYSKGQAVLFLIDTCVKERTGGEYGVSDIIEHNRRKVDNLTYRSFVESIAREVAGKGDTKYRRKQEEKISSWLKEYVYTSRNPSEASVLGQNDSECWF